MEVHGEERAIGKMENRWEIEPAVPVLGRRRQEDQVFEVSSDYK
jgi:hypothetical protein